MTIPMTANARAGGPLPATVALLALLVASSPLAAEDCHEHHPKTPAEQTQGAPRTEHLGAMLIPDPVLYDQDGNEVHFYSDLVAGRVVAMNFIFTTCTTICPPMGANFGKLQEIMGDRVGKDFEMISVSVDPAVDTPQRLNAWAKKFGRQPGWTLVTGSKPEVDKLLKALKVFTPDKTDHSPILLLGDDAHNHWTRTYGLAPPAKLAEMIDGMTLERLADTSALAKANTTGGTR